MRVHLSIAMALALALPLAVSPPAAADEADQLAQRLIALRGDVEQLNSELEQSREAQRAELLGLAQQRAQLTADLGRQQLGAQEARDRLQTAATERSGAGVADAALQPVLLAALAEFDRQVVAGLPFKVAERRAALAAIRVEIESGRLGSHRAANRVWAFIEDEFRLARETALHQQTLTLDGANVLADVVKVGSMMLFFRSADGGVGYAERERAGWRWVVASEAGQQAQIEALFDALDKQIRQGYFELPNVLAVSGAR